MDSNFLSILAAALIPIIIGALWYGSMLFQNVWIKEASVTEVQTKTVNMPLIFGVSFICSLMIAIFLKFIVVHQVGVFQTLINEPGFKEETGEAFAFYTNFMEMYGDRFRSFSHGVIHGIMTGLLLITPIITTKALFERKSFKYIAINAGYWIVTLALMGGIICKWS